MSVFQEGDVALYYSFPVVVDAVFIDSVTGRPYYKIVGLSEETRFPSLGFAWAGEYQLSTVPRRS